MAAEPQGEPRRRYSGFGGHRCGGSLRPRAVVAGAAGTAAEATRGRRAALLRRTVRSGDRADARNQPGHGEEPGQQGDREPAREAARGEGSDVSVEDDELAGELRRLFTDSRLDLPARTGAEDAVVAGARRIRRRRVAATTIGGTFAAALLVAGSLVVGGLRAETGQAALPAASGPVIESPVPVSTSSPAAPVPAESSALSPPQPGPPQPMVSQGQRLPDVSSPPTRVAPPRTTPLPGPAVGPAGYGRLRLGMPFDIAKATGMLSSTSTPPSGCATYSLIEGQAQVSSVSISSTDGVVRFQASGAHTPEGVKAGSPI